MVQKKIAISALLLSFIACASITQLAFAQAYPTQGTTSSTLEESLKLAKERLASVQAHPGAGSGTPLLAADGMITAMLASAAVFGILFGICIFYAKSIESKRKLEARR